MREQSLEVRAAVHAALAEPHRLAIVDALRPSDLAPSTLARLLGIDSNLIAHHIQVLVDAGLVERLVSSGDHRRRYLRLRHEALDRLFLPLRLEVNRVLFVCTQNSARSQLAAALWNQVHRRPGSSAGTHPAKRIHPLAVQVASRHGLDLTSAAPHSLPAAPKFEGLLVT
ncbi:MAG: helix-turn-helix domain-containing protein, partial [Dehalococcoidia bacterium]